MQNWLMPELLKRVSGMRILLTYPKLTLDRRLCWVRITRIGAVEVACEFPILFEDFSVVFSHDLLHAARIVIDLVCSMTWAHDQEKPTEHVHSFSVDTNGGTGGLSFSGQHQICWQKRSETATPRPALLSLVVLQGVSQLLHINPIFF